MVVRVVQLHTTFHKNQFGAAKLQYGNLLIVGRLRMSHF